VRAYKFFTAKWAIDNVERNRLKVSRFADLNDPFELFGYQLSAPAHRRIFRALREYTEREWGVLCFSRSWSNPLLWSHYADKHRGICLGFNIPDRLIQEIKYASSRFSFELDAALGTRTSQKDFARRVLCTKFKDWRYEDEVRLLVPLEGKQHDRGHYFVNFGSELKLRTAIVGPRCPPRSGAELGRALAATPARIELVRARLAFRSFKVVTDRRPAMTA
jgi:hypothetical protein